MTQRQDKHDISRLEVPVQGDVPAFPARDHKFAQAVLRRPADERVPGEYGYGFIYRGDSRCRKSTIVGSEKIEYAFKITNGSIGVGD